MELFIHELTNRTMPFIFDYECYDMLTMSPLENLGKFILKILQLFFEQSLHAVLLDCFSKLLKILRSVWCNFLIIY